MTLTLSLEAAMPDDDNLRPLIHCSACEGSGYRYEWYTAPDGADGAIIHGDPCPYCDGLGADLVRVWPIEQEDLPSLSLEADIAEMKR